MRTGIHPALIKIAWDVPLKLQRRPIWENGDIQITQTNDEVEVVGEDRLQSNFRGYLIKYINDLILNNIVTYNFIIGVHLHGKSCTHIVHYPSHHQ
jgi:hypothetical protein